MRSIRLAPGEWNWNLSLPITCLTSIGASSGGASSGSRSNRKFFDLLVYLVRNRERVVSKDDLLQAIWGGRIVSESTMTSRINAARKAVGDNGETQHLIRTVPRKGIRFVGIVREERKPAAPIDARSTELKSVGRLSIVVLPFTNLS